jgi:hypothetical protein
LVLQQVLQGEKKPEAIAARVLVTGEGQVLVTPEG